MSNPLQVKASNPYVGAWVSASAGTGKTKILTDRAIRLLFRQVDPSKILCITFTNAAANEMHERIMHRLSQIAASNDRQITEILVDMTGKMPDKKMIAQAKSLYEQYLRNENKISIHTLHSYCQKILKKFPLEAGITPNFSIIDEAGQKEAISIIRKEILLSDELQSINRFFAENFHQSTIDELFANILQHRIKFAKIDSANGKKEVKKIASEFASELVCKLIEKIESKSNDEYNILRAYPLVQNLVGVDATAADIKQFFLTKSGEPKKRIVPVKLVKPGSSMHDELLQIQQHVYELDQLERKVEVESFSKIISIFATKFLSMYENYKKARSYLDYDDLIIKTCLLLRDAEARSWVLYKLDGGIEHILVDEAQDTSYDQWLIIEALVQEFFAQGAEDENSTRTIFVVGDEKQSIFSFQGADVQSFLKMNKQFTRKISASNHNFVNIELDVSYRSCNEILRVVHQLFDNLPQEIIQTYSRGNRFKIPKIKAYRSHHPGKVELWDIEQAPQQNDSFWQYNSDENAENTNAISRLATNIAEYINQTITSGATLPASGRQINAGDFMILFRTRNQLTKEVIKELQSRSIPTSGLDRIKLSDELLIKDLVSIARFVLNPEDKLNKEAMLKSPFIAANITELLDIDQLISIIFDVYKNNSATEFFQKIIEIFNIRQYATSAYLHDSTDLLNEFVKLLVRYAASKDGSLQGFIYWFDSQEAEIKRESNNINQVQIMTVHGSKGLQAPIVILCDTTSIPSQSPGFYWSESGQMHAALNADFVPQTFQDMKEKVKHHEFQEYMRLLYVAMTRAEDNLIICGYSNKKSLPTNCWYMLAKQAMIALNSSRIDNKYIYQESAAQYVMQSATSTPAPAKNVMKFTPGSYSLQQYMTKHNISADKLTNDDNLNTKPLISPLQSTRSIEYGLVFHKILEDTVKIREFHKIDMHPLIKTLTQKQQKKLLASIKLLQNNTEFLQLLKDSEIKTELSIGAHKDGADIGRIDLLIFKGDVIHIIDYKTDNIASLDLTQIPENYISQLESYQRAMATIFPDYKCKKYILWLENAYLQQIYYSS